MTPILAYDSFVFCFPWIFAHLTLKKNGCGYDLSVRDQTNLSVRTQKYLQVARDRERGGYV